MQFTVTGLDGASKYAYRLAVKDENQNEIVAYSGEFATTGYVGEVNPGGAPESPEGIEDINVNAQAFKIIRDNQILILRGDKIYTIDGRLVR